MNDFPAIPVYVFGILLLIFSVPARGNDGSEKEEQSHQSGSIQRIDLQKSHSFTDFGDHVLSPDSRYIACSHNSEISVFDRKENFQIVKTYSHKNDVMSISFSPSGEYLVSGGKDGEIKIRKGKNQFREIATYVNESRIQDLSFSPQGRFLVSTTLEDVVSIRSSEEQFHEVYRFKTEEKEATIQSIGFSPDGKYLLLANSAGKKEYKKGEKSHIRF